MVFTSPIFVFAFLPALIFFYYFAKNSLRNYVLLAFSLFFYAFGEPVNILIMIVSIIVNYFAGIWIEKKQGHNKHILTLAVAFDLLMLFLFKYLNFTVDLLNRVTGAGIRIRDIALPIGISFYTFQIMSYTVDVYRGSCKAQKSIFDLALYVSLFPQLIAGPIVRYVDIEKQIHERHVDTDGLYRGFMRFAIGFARKVLIADQLSPLVEKAFSGLYPSWQIKWLGIIAYTLQIYYDFSGYSDMAIGLGGIFGFRFQENFDDPYISKSIREFWRRWHISLSTWFRDYLYIPLGGSRRGRMRTYLNLLIVFTVTGLWHGASLNFLVWGLYYGFFLILERIGFGKILEKIPAVFQHLYAILVVVFGWVFFRAENLQKAVDYIRGMFTASASDWIHFNYLMERQYIFIIIIGIIFAMPVFSRKKEKIEKQSVLYSVVVLLLFFLSICYMVGSGYSPFLYFRF